MDTVTNIQDAILNGEDVEFVYNGEPRVVTPEEVITGPSGNILVGVERVKGYRRYTINHITDFHRVVIR